MFLKTKTSARLSVLASVFFVFSAAAIGAENEAEDGPVPLFLTATNGSSNVLVVINSQNKQADLVPTGGAGGAGGNAGGVAVQGSLAAAVNFGSSNVTIFVRHGNT